MRFHLHIRSVAWGCELKQNTQHKIVDINHDMLEFFVHFLRCLFERRKDVQNHLLKHPFRAKWNKYDMQPRTQLRLELWSKYFSFRRNVALFSTVSLDTQWAMCPEILHTNQNELNPNEQKWIDVIWSEKIVPSDYFSYNCENGLLNEESLHTFLQTQVKWGLNKSQTVFPIGVSTAGMHFQTIYELKYGFWMLRNE